MDQAETWEEFRDACSFSGLPGENMVWADRAGNIGWQSVGLTPVRFGWDGSLPIPGNGAYEWTGYVPIKQMPHISNPKSGWYGTANHHNVPDGYPNIFSDFYSDPARYWRLKEVMDKAEDHTIEDSMALQYDNKSMNAEKLIPVIERLEMPENLKFAQNILSNWDYRLDRDSTAAAIFDLWEQSMINMIYLRNVPENRRDNVSAPGRQRVTEWIIDPTQLIFGEDPSETRDQFIIKSLKIAVDQLTEQFGRDMDQWTYGNLHYAEIIHPLSHLLDDEMKNQVNITKLPRGGGSNTLNANHGNRQRSGASFRMIVDTADWDLSVGTNSPGQSADPRSEHYDNLFENWNKGDYFPLYYSKDKIIDNQSEKIILNP